MAMKSFGAGVLSDRFLAKNLMCFGLIVCGISTFIFSMATDIKQMTIIWFINGLGQGFSLPTIIKLTKDNSHSTRFATNWSVVLISVNFAGIVNPFISAFITQTFNWKTCLYISAFITSIVSAIAFISIDNSNKISENINKNSRTKNSKNDSKINSGKSDILKNPMLWVCIISRFIVAVTRISVSDWSQIYLINEKQIDVYTIMEIAMCTPENSWHFFIL